MTSSEPLCRLWYKALYEEDCVEVRKLLEKDPGLIRHGWNANPSRWYDGRLFDGSKPIKEAWKGRTALHVGARRGCVDLIKLVLLCYLEELRNYGSVEEQDAAFQSRGVLVATPGQFNLVESEGVDKNGQNTGEKIACADEVSEAEHKSSSSHLPWTSQRSFPPSDETLLERQTVSISNALRHSVDGNCSKNHGGNLDHSYVTRKDLRDLVLMKDGWYGLEALAMATIHYNPDIIDLLIYSFGKCDDPPYKVRRGTDLPKVLRSKDTLDSLDSLRQATMNFMASLDDEVRRECLRQYSRHRDFNFLSREEYLFHFLSSRESGQIVKGKMNWSSCRMALWKEVRSLEGSLWQFLLELKDGRGRTPFHVAVDVGTASHFVKLFTNAEEEMLVFALTAHDRAGRSPLHRAASRSLADSLDVLLKYCGVYEKVFATNQATWLHPLARFVIYAKEKKYRFAQGHEGKTQHVFSVLSEGYGFRGFSQAFKPLHVAIINRRYSPAKKLIERSVELGSLRDIWYFKEYKQLNRKEQIYFRDTEAAVIEWGLIEFACLVNADIEFIEYLLKEYPRLSKLISKRDGCTRSETLKCRRKKILLPFHPKKSDIPETFSVSREEEEYLKKATLKDPWKALHMVASFGKYEMLRMFIDNSQSDPNVEDFEGNNGLHYAMNVREFGEFRLSILDLVTCDSFQSEAGRRKKILDHAQQKDVKAVEKGYLVEREGCINLLLKDGYDLFKCNRKHQVPDPHGDLIKDAEFCSWWYKKQEKEVGAIQNKLNNVSNAVSVTAALVATASYVGPLQPPLGYAADDQIQYENVWVAVFVFCDTLSFYLAIISIILALIPSLPMWQQPMIKELRRTQTMVTMAVSVLLPSVLCVLIAFASSSMAVVSAGLLSSIGGRLTIATMCLGAPLILGAFFLFSVRLLGGLFPGYCWARGMYKLCN